MMKRLLVPLLLLVGGAPALAQEAVPAEAYARVNTALVETHVLPRYEGLDAATAQLAEAAETWCAGEEGSDHDLLRERHGAALDAWMAVQHLQFGPVELFMRASRFYFWPEAQGRLTDAMHDVLEDSNGPISPQQLRKAGVAVQGLPAVELLLYAGKDLKAETTSCRLLEAIAANLKQMAGAIVADWRGGDVAFARIVATPGPDNLYFASHREAALAFFKSLHGGLQMIADIKLMPVLGTDLGAARPQLAESRLSGRSLRNILVNLEALEELYMGTGGASLSTLVQKHGDDPDLDPLLRRAFAMTIATARSIEVPLTEAVVDPDRRPQAEKLLTQVAALKQLVRTRLAAALNLQVGFNALDGD